jgi:hypothetical protein
MPRRALGIAMAIALVGATVGVVGAAIPQAGVYTGCYNKTSGLLRVIDAAIPSQKCASSEQKITWNQTGIQGIQGIQGVKGDQGIQGPPGADATLPDFLGPQIWKIRFIDDGDQGTQPGGTSTMNLPAARINYDHQDTIDSFVGDISQCTHFFAVTITLNTELGEEIDYISSDGGPLELVTFGPGHFEYTDRTSSGPVSWRASCSGDTGFLLVNFDLDIHFSVGPGSTFN